MHDVIVIQIVITYGIGYPDKVTRLTCEILQPHA